LEREHGSLLRSLDTRPRQPSSAPATGAVAPATFISFKNGTETLARTLAAQLQGTLHLRSTVAEIVRHGDGYRVVLAEDGAAGVPHIDADGVVLAVPAWVAQTLLASIAPAAVSPLGELRTVSSGVIYLAYRRDEIAQPPSGFGVVIPRAEQRDFNAITWVSNKFQRRVPPGFMLVRLFYGGARTPHMMERSDAEIEILARREVSTLAGITAMPLFARLFRWWNAQPQYDVHHLRRMDQINRALPSGVELIGTPYHGVGIPDCVNQGNQAAQRLVAKLT
jgi:protoporphyrinogen/coproporphyrinogen III oxidase